MTGRFYKFLDKNRENIRHRITSNVNRTILGNNILTGIVEFDIGEINGGQVVSLLNVRRSASKTTILLSTKIMVEDMKGNRNKQPEDNITYTRKNFFNEAELSFMINKISSVISELGFEDTDVGQLFINNANVKEYQSRFFKIKKHMKIEKINGCPFDIGYEFKPEEINIRFMMDNKKEDCFISDIKLIEPKASHFSDSIIGGGLTDNVFYEDLLPDLNVLFSIDKDWKLLLFFKNHSSIIDILNMKLPKKEEEELFEISFSS